MNEPNRIKQFLSESLGGGVSDWEQKPNGQMLLRVPGVVVSYYTTTRRILWQGRLESHYQGGYRCWLQNKNSETDVVRGREMPSTRQSYSSSSSPPATLSNPLQTTTISLPNKGQKSTQHECEVFLREMELESNDINQNLWERKPNGQLLATLFHLGRGNMSFYTTTGTLLFQGRDCENIKSTFLNWRRRALELFEEAYETLIDGDINIGEGFATSQQRAPKRQKVQTTNENENPSIQHMGIDTMKQELHSYGIRTEYFLERTEFQTALTMARENKRSQIQNKEVIDLCDTDDDEQDESFASTGSKYANESHASYSSSKQHSMEGQRLHKSSVSSDEKECKHCNYPISKHRSYFEEGKMCKLSGKYKCGCGRHWWGMALKIQRKNSNEADAFPSFTFPDCLKCKENYSVVLLEHKCTDSTAYNITGRGHQRHLCQLCKSGSFCPRANSSSEI